VPSEMQAYEHVNFAASYMILNDPTRALPHIERAIMQIPQFMPAHNNKAAILDSLEPTKRKKSGEGLRT
jgi:hypothetical protein